MFKSNSTTRGCYFKSLFIPKLIFGEFEVIVVNTNWWNNSKCVTTFFKHVEIVVIKIIIYVSALVS